MSPNRTYYGEYSLSYWIQLILKKDIVLPPYQRAFVWEPEDFKTLLESFKEGQFIPPVTIGAFKKDNVQQNLIIDGQQRLTTILLAYIERFPKKVAGEIITSSLVNENDDENDSPENMIEWDFNRLLEKGRKKAEIQSKCNSDQYDILDPLPEDFFNKTYLGFSYIIPSIADEREIQKFYSKLFRNINIQGKTLYVLESRAALYYLNPEFIKWFDPDFTAYISSSVVDKSVKSKMDFVRYLSLLSQYKRNGTSNGIGYRYASRMEAYYSEYINAVSYDEESNLFVKFSSLYPDGNYQASIDRLTRYIGDLGFDKIYPSIIDMDIHFFGLIYYSLIEKKSLTENHEEFDTLKDKLTRAIRKVRKIENHVKSPSCLKYIRVRIDESLNIYKDYFD